jgi:hypothetical protein
VRVQDGALAVDWHDLPGIRMRHRDRDSWDLLLGGHYEDTPMPFVFRPAYDGIAGIEVGLEPTVDPVFFAREAPRLTPAELARLAGTYEMGPLTAVVSVVGDALQVEIAGGKPAALVARDAAHFDVPGQAGTRLEFVLDGDRVERLVVQPAGVFTPVGSRP